MDMVLIFSDSEDISTNEVISWLRYLNVSFIRVNVGDTIDIHQQYQIYSDDNDDNIISLCGREIRINEIESIWYRRGGVSKRSFSIYTKSLDTWLQNKLQQNLEDDHRSLTEYMFFCLNRKDCSLGSHNLYSVNKLKALSIAKSVGLNIPNTLITSDKTSLLQFKNEVGAIIIKSIQDGLHDVYNNHIFHSYTEEISVEFINSLNINFPLTCFQKKIDKKIEIRTFFINDELYSMAIFSQNNQQTKVDYRKYDDQKPNRTVPFEMPNDIKQKIVLFMHKLGLNCGSLDIIYTMDKEFVFLEVNPIGQYGMVSEPCNYYLDKVIAENLKKWNTGKK